MDPTLQKTIVFILFILIGLLLKPKFGKKEEVAGLKKIILNLALPATIFLALLSIEIDSGLLLLPLFAFSLNILLFLSFPFLLPVLGISQDSTKYRTARLLLPSLAPGLSCFPFVMEFLGDSYLAKAAMADLGNKTFVLLFLYVVAMNWHYRRHTHLKKKGASKLKSLALAMISEPVNIFIIIALILVFSGISMDSLPIFVNDALNRLSGIMTPLVLLFIGLAVNIKRKQLTTILSLLLVRAGLVAFLSGVFLMFSGITTTNDILLLLSFGFSACSFWPFAHISAVGVLEHTTAKKKKTFDGTFAINVLALSFPLSTLLVLSILTSGEAFAHLGAIFSLSGLLLFLGYVPVIYSKVKALRRRSAQEKNEWIRYRLSATENLWRPTKDASQ
ncbi:permease [Flavobacteriaceae bacterium TP-CH-4]|uniref:Permease n=1 Tax=Pelagihabitans pacificus TaxID=2696054 RepID=A0A967ASY8_9FLAO|nr:permease [Pelagihabitans pacificus]NHF58880.1 permease [Pelagihabitans pacificus]